MVDSLPFAISLLVANAESNPGEMAIHPIRSLLNHRIPPDCGGLTLKPMLVTTDKKTQAASSRASVMSGKPSTDHGGDELRAFARRDASAVTIHMTTTANPIAAAGTIGIP